MRIDRRTFVAGTASLAGGLAGGLAAPRVARAAAEADLSELHARARDEGEVAWYVVYLSSELAERYAGAFTAAYPGVRVSPVRLTAQVAYQRLNQDVQAGIANCDVFASTDFGHHVALKERKLLMPYKPQNAGFIDARFRDVDPDGHFHAVAATTVTLIHNTNKVKAADAPKTWKELPEARWRNQVTVGHPGYSGFVGTWVVQMEKLFGWDYFERLADGRPQVGRSIIDTITNTVSGERSVGAGPSGLARLEASRGNPIGLSTPAEGEVLMLTPSAIMANTRRPNAAKLFTEWLYTRSAAQLVADNYDTPLRSDVTLKPGVEPFERIKTIRPSVPEIVAGIPSVAERWRDTFGV